MRRTWRARRPPAFVLTPLFLGTLSTATIAGALLVAGVQESSRDRDEPAGELVVELHMSCQAQSLHRMTVRNTLPLISLDDEDRESLTVNLDGTLRFDYIPFESDYDEFRRTNADLRLSASGNGTRNNVHVQRPIGDTPAVRGTEKGSWSMRAQQAEAPPGLLDVLGSVREGWYEIRFGREYVEAADVIMEGQINISAGSEHSSTTVEGAASSAVPCMQAVNEAIHSDESFRKALVGSFDPKIKRFRRERSATYVLPKSRNEFEDGYDEWSAKVVLQYAVSFTREPPPVQAIIVPGESYRNWRPQAGRDELTPGNSIAFDVRLHKRGDPEGEPELKAKSFTIRLLGTTHEKGIATNWPPPLQAKKTPDLRLANEAPVTPSDDGQSATVTGTGLTGTAFRVVSYDYGASARVQVTATLEDDSTIKAVLEGLPGESEVGVPRDQDGNRVADSWDQRFHRTTKEIGSDDDDAPVGDGCRGDGLSYYEEYRGFFINGLWSRTEPEVKDLFVLDPGNLGIGYFGRSGLAIHFIRPAEVDDRAADANRNTRVINGNGGLGRVANQHAVLLVDARLGGHYGEAVGGPGVPKDIERVLVDRAKSLGVSTEELDNTIAHELAHAVNVRHHGDTRSTIPEGHPIFEQSGGTWVKAAVAPKGGWLLAERGGQCSGVVDCIMRYNSQGDFYRCATGRYMLSDFGKLVRMDVFRPIAPPGDIFCDRRTGTGENAPGLPCPRAGDASDGRGDCIHKICVNDMRH